MLYTIYMLISNIASTILLKIPLYLLLALIFILTTSYFMQSYPNKLEWRVQFPLTTIYSDSNFREDFKYTQYRIFLWKCQKYAYKTLKDATPNIPLCSICDPI